MKAFEEELGVTIMHAWGMTETSPLGTGGRLKAKHDALSPADSLALRSKQGRVVFGVDMKIVGDDGHELPHDGVAFGDLLVRGPWVIREYFKGDGGDPLVGGTGGITERAGRIFVEAGPGVVAGFGGK